MNMDDFLIHHMLNEEFDAHMDFIVMVKRRNSYVEINFINDNKERFMKSYIRTLDSVLPKRKKIGKYNL